MSAPTATSSATAPPLDILIPSLARSVVSILQLWPALRTAVSEQWGGDSSSAKRDWMASEIIDYFETCYAALRKKVVLDKTRPEITVEDLEGLVDDEDLAEMLFHMMEDEFEVELEDGSPEEIGRQVVLGWRKIVNGDLTILTELESQVKAKAGKKEKARIEGETGDVDEMGNILERSDEDEDDDDEDYETDDEAPKLVQVKEKVEPVVDEDGFELVQGKGKGRGKK